MNYGRTVTRMHEGTRKGAEYGCAIQRYPSKHRAEDIALYVVAVIALVVLGWLA